MAFPKTNWKYLNCSPFGEPTSPGTEIKVTPESAVPIIPKATKYNLEFLLALKKAAQAFAFIQQRSFVTPDDVQAVFVAVVAHRIGLSEAEAVQLMQQVHIS